MQITQNEVLALARQLEPGAQRAVALALLRRQERVPALAELRSRTRPKLAALLRQRGVDIDRDPPDIVDQAIHEICEEP